MIENEKELQEPVIQGPGQILKLAREKANLSSQDIADKMKLKKSLVEDIEQDNYDINLSLTFVRGYLKLYAKHVQVGEEEVIAAYEGLSNQKKEPVKLQSFSRRVANQANDDKLMLVTYLIVAAVIALVVVWWFQQSSTDVAKSISAPTNISDYQDVSSQDVVTLESTIPEDTFINESESLIVTPVVEEDLTFDEPVVVQSDVQSDVQSGARLPEVVEEPVVDNQAIAAVVVDDVNNSTTIAAHVDLPVIEAKPVELIFDFAGDCWVQLIDATGEKIAYGVKVKGRVMPVTGIPPFVVTLGAPEVVSIRYAGESLDMSFLPAGRIAKFDLPLSE